MTCEKFNMLPESAEEELIRFHFVECILKLKFHGLHSVMI